LSSEGVPALQEAAAGAPFTSSQQVSGPVHFEIKGHWKLETKSKRLTEFKDEKMMTKIEAIIQPGRFEAVKEMLTEIGVGGMTITDVRGHGRQKGHTETYRGREYTVDLLPKVKLEMVLPDNLVDAAVEAILKTASSGKIGDGKIFLSKVEETIRIRNQERGAVAL
jgi:nitrogen regulatory protein P-II 1